ESLRLTEVRVRKWTESAETATVYNFTVTTHHVYFANDVLVHNRNLGDPDEDSLDEGGAAEGGTSGSSPDDVDASSSSPPPQDCVPSNCDGCCNGSNVCVVGTDDWACGSDGTDCVDCSASSQTCGSGGVCN